MSVWIGGSVRGGRGAPLRHHLLRRRGHDRAVAEQLIVTEDGCCDGALPAPILALDRDHRVAEERLEDLDLNPALREFRRPVEKQLLHCVGAGEEGHARRAGREHDRLRDRPPRE